MVTATVQEGAGATMEVEVDIIGIHREPEGHPISAPVKPQLSPMLKEYKAPADPS
jgi:hypothetical protein